MLQSESTQWQRLYSLHRSQTRSLRPLFLSLWPWNQREVNRLRHMREDLTNEIGDCIGESMND